MMPTFLPRLDLDPSKFPGGVGIWGALPAIYDTTDLPVEHGVHVHARSAPNQKLKDIDASYGEVHVVAGTDSTTITEASATPYVAAAVLGLPLRGIACPYCGTPHLDVDRFAVRPHHRHLCQHCNVEFLEVERSVGNPIVVAKRTLGDVALTRPTKPGKPGPLKVSQGASCFSGGILIWASNPAILWTAARDEAEGIHVHGFEAGIAEPLVDETYQRVEVDGVNIDAAMARAFMVQQSLPYLRGVVQPLRCPKCNAAHFDELLPFVVEPHRNHPCLMCGFVLITMSAVISNPIVETLANLYANAAAAGRKKNPRAP